MRRWYLWVPVVMVASLMYWTVALGLGGLSLMAASALSAGQDLGMGMGTATYDQAVTNRYDQSYDPIVVHLEESVEPEDVNDDVGCGYTDQGDAAPTGPGQTAF
jgi:hypothetical protein